MPSYDIIHGHKIKYRPPTCKVTVRQLRKMEHVLKLLQLQAEKLYERACAHEAAHFEGDDFTAGNPYAAQYRKATKERHLLYKEIKDCTC